MQKIDFSQEGGFPLTQDTFAFLQQAYTEALTALAAVGGDGPVIITGVQPSGSAYTAGWIYWNGELFYFAGTPGVGVAPGNVLIMVVNENDQPLNYNDGNTHNSMQVRTLVMQGGSNTTTSTQFPLSTLAPYGKEAAFTTVAIATIPATGSISYRKNALNNTLQIKGSLNVIVANVSATGVFSGPTYINLATLAAAYAPATDAPFSCYYRYHNEPILDDTGLDHITQMNGELRSTGDLSIGFIKGASNYILYFNAIIPLD